MDVRPITTDRVRVLDRQLDRAALDQLQDLALRVFTELDLETLIRLDVRADDVGRLYVLEANPKPDLAAPRPERTSLIATGLAAHDMTYDDLIHSLLADRIDLLLSQRRGAAKQLSDLLH